MYYNHSLTNVITVCGCVYMWLCGCVDVLDPNVQEISLQLDSTVVQLVAKYLSYHEHVPFPTIVKPLQVTQNSSLIKLLIALKQPSRYLVYVCMNVCMFNL